MAASSLSSMTGFARAAGEGDAHAWVWEARSVNARGLDVRVRLAPGFEWLETAVRELAGKRFQRGSLNLTLALDGTAESSGFRVNQAMLDQLFEILPEIQNRMPGLRPASADGILSIRGVMEPVQEPLTEARRDALGEQILKSLDGVLADLAAARGREGARLTPILAGHVDDIERLTAEAGNLAATQPEAIFRRLGEQVRALLDSGADLSADRLNQEAAILATKADIREELGRLSAHVAEARDLMAGKGAVGRKLDFLCQEFNREANTLCSKSSDVGLTKIGLALKAVIEQFREQVQNVE